MATKEISTINMETYIVTDDWDEYSTLNQNYGDDYNYIIGYVKDIHDNHLIYEEYIRSKRVIGENLFRRFRQLEEELEVGEIDPFIMRFIESD